jgi:hypothetical protein
MYVYLYNSSLYLSIHFRNDLYFFIVYWSTLRNLTVRNAGSNVFR